MLKTELKTIFDDQELVDRIAGEMQRTVLMDSDIKTLKALSAVVYSLFYPYLP